MSRMPEAPFVRLFAIVAISVGFYVAATSFRSPRFLTRRRQ